MPEFSEQGNILHVVEPTKHLVCRIFAPHWLDMCSKLTNIPSSLLLFWVPQVTPCTAPFHPWFCSCTSNETENTRTVHVVLLRKVLPAATSRLCSPLATSLMNAWMNSIALYQKCVRVTSLLLQVMWGHVTNLLSWYYCYGFLLLWLLLLWYFVAMVFCYLLLVRASFMFYIMNKVG